MPQINGTGPEGKGQKTVRRLGLCKTNLNKIDLLKLGKGQCKKRKSGLEVIKSKTLHPKL